MAFFGIEVKPGKPFIHQPLRSRLHLSQATLGIGNATKKCIVQCNIGNKSPVFLCCLLPEKTECCQLNVEFEESDVVAFSVIGPLSVHLTGFYASNLPCNHRNDDESESYGEDIGDTETERSENSEESEYGGSFINDDDLEVFPSSLDYSAQRIAETPDLKKSKDGKKTRRRLRKKYELSESENYDSPQKNDFTSAAAAAAAADDDDDVVLDSEFEDDALPISSLLSAKHESNIGDKTEKLHEADLVTEPNKKLAINDESCIRNQVKKELVFDCDNGTPKEKFPRADLGMTKLDLNQKLASDEVFGVRNQVKKELVFDCDNGTQKKGGQELEEREKIHEADLGMAELELNQKLASDEEMGVRNPEQKEFVLGGENGMPEKERQEPEKKDKIPEADLGVTGLELSQKLASNEEANLQQNLSPASTQLNLEDGTKLKRKRKLQVGEKTVKDNVAKEDKGKKTGVDAVMLDVHVEDKETQEQVGEKKQKRKKRRKNKDDEDARKTELPQRKDDEDAPKAELPQHKDDEDATKTELPLLPGSEKNVSVVAMDAENAHEKATQLSNGIIIEEIEMGKPNGKVAAAGKKVRFHYTGKLKESGQVFDSTAGKAPLKFRLGGEEVPDVWNAGLDGMLVGGKRRLTVPSSVSYKRGASEIMPPNSCLVFEVELVKVSR